jgi:hypothetical protein
MSEEPTPPEHKYRWQRVPDYFDPDYPGTPDAYLEAKRQRVRETKIATMEFHELKEAYLQCLLRAGPAQAPRMCREYRRLYWQQKDWVLPPAVSLRFVLLAFCCVLYSSIVNCYSFSPSFFFLIVEPQNLLA